jgi:hypothetical protein
MRSAHKEDKVSKFSFTEEVVNNIKNRREKIQLWIESNNPEVLDEQRHLDNGPESAYWHYGYMMALEDMLSSIEQTSDLDEIKNLVESAKNSYLAFVADTSKETSNDSSGAKDYDEKDVGIETNLEARIVATYHWHWMPGMRRYVYRADLDRQSYGRMISDRMLIPEDSMENPMLMEIEKDAKPDLSDPATLGAVVQTIRSVFSDDTISFQHHGHGVEVTSINSFDTQTISGALAKHISRFSYFSEMEAATCLLEFATQLKNNDFID